MLDLAEAKEANKKTYQLRQIVISTGKSTLRVKKRSKRRSKHMIKT